MDSLRQSALKIERDHSPVDPKIAGERKPLGGGGSYCSVLQGGEHEAKGFGDTGKMPHLTWLGTQFSN